MQCSAPGEASFTGRAVLRFPHCLNAALWSCRSASSATYRDSCRSGPYRYRVPCSWCHWSFCLHLSCSYRSRCPPIASPGPWCLPYLCPSSADSYCLRRHRPRSTRSRALQRQPLPSWKTHPAYSLLGSGLTPRYPLRRARVPRVSPQGVRGREDWLAGRLRRGPSSACRSAPDTIRTCDQQFRKLLLYPAELRGRKAEISAPGGRCEWMRIRVALDFRDRCVEISAHEWRPGWCHGPRQRESARWPSARPPRTSAAVSAR